MENSLLLDAIERFLNDEMTEEEKKYFTETRRNNPDVDQMVVEHSFFLNQLSGHGDRKRFRHLVNEVQKDLEAEGIIKLRQQKTGKLIQLWNRHKRVIAVAASIAGIVSLLIASVISGFNTGKNQNLTPLVQKINEQATKTKQIENKLNQLQASGSVANPAIEARFRATGFIIDADHNYLATNAHVVLEAKNKLIIEDHKGRQFNAKAVYVNIPADLAIIKVTDTGFKKLPTVPFSVKNIQAELGDQVYMLGYPKDESVYGEGYISAKNGYALDTIFCQLNTDANEGSSGSPVLSSGGELVGILSSKETNAAGVVYAIKPANIFKAIEEVKKIAGNEDIKISASSSFKNLNRVNQIKKLQEYVFMIKGN